MTRKVAVVLFNLGGPDGPADVRPFLFNLFNDPAIIAAPGPVRTALAWWISTTRAPSARANYAKMGGGSPLLGETLAQADALTAALAGSDPDIEWRLFTAMRYWLPFVEETAAEVRDWAPDETVLAPLYPQFSTTTTGSSLAAWNKAAGDLEARAICCWPEADGFVAAHARLIRETWDKAGRPAHARLLFSAHGLPEKIVRAGDPYRFQVERTCAAVGERVADILGDQAICYQSRVGPLAWIGPSTEAEIDRAAGDGKAIVLSPIAFVSEHIETLVELDEEYAARARDKGVEVFARVPALGTAPDFIAELASLVKGALSGGPGYKPPGNRRLCPAACVRCPIAAGS